VQQRVLKSLTSCKLSADPVSEHYEFRPSMALNGRTPREVYDALPPANVNPRFEPRPRWPKRSPCAAPQAAVKGTRGTKFRLVVGYLEDRKHLPVIELRRAA
jgi:hypothetical protein